jgi:hypothetical protein
LACPLNFQHDLLPSVFGEHGRPLACPEDRHFRITKVRNCVNATKSR